MGPWVTALSFVAAYYSSVVIIGGGAFGWKFGLSTLWVGAGNVLIGTTLAWIVLGRRIRRFTENLDAMTLPGFFAGRYGIGRGAHLLSAAATGLVPDHLQRHGAQGHGQRLRGADGPALLGGRGHLGRGDPLLHRRRRLPGRGLDQLGAGHRDDRRADAADLHVRCRRWAA